MAAAGTCYEHVERSRGRSPPNELILLRIFLIDIGIKSAPCVTDCSKYRFATEEQALRGKIILLIGSVLNCFSPITAQTKATPSALIQPRPETTFKRYQDSRSYLFRSVPSSGILVQGPLGRFHSPIRSSASPTINLHRLLGSENSETLFASQWRFPLIEFCSGHLQVSAFQSTLHMDNIMFGPYRGALRGFDIPRLSRSGGSQSLDLSGLSLGFRFGHGWRSGQLIASRLPRIVHSIEEATH
jgi:hypothetical protein